MFTENTIAMDARIRESFSHLRVLPHLASAADIEEVARQSFTTRERVSEAVERFRRAIPVYVMQAPIGVFGSCVLLSEHTPESVLKTAAQKGVLRHRVTYDDGRVFLQFEFRRHEDAVEIAVDAAYLAIMAPTTRRVESEFAFHV